MVVNTREGCLEIIDNHGRTTIVQGCAAGKQLHIKNVGVHTAPLKKTSLDCRDGRCKSRFHRKFVRPSKKPVVSVHQAKRPSLLTRVNGSPTLKILHRLFGKATHVGKAEVLRSFTRVRLHTGGDTVKDIASIGDSGIRRIRNPVRARR